MIFHELSAKKIRFDVSYELQMIHMMLCLISSEN